MGRALDDPAHPEAPAGEARRVRERNQLDWEAVVDERLDATAADGQTDRALASRQQVGHLAWVARADDLLAVELANELLTEEPEEVGGRHGAGPRHEGIVGNNLPPQLGAEQVLRHSDRGHVYVVAV